MDNLLCSCGKKLQFVAMSAEPQALYKCECGAVPTETTALRAQLAACEAKLANAERERDDLSLELAELCQKSRVFRLAWINKKCGIGIHHSALEEAEQSAKEVLARIAEAEVQTRVTLCRARVLGTRYFTR